MDCIRCGGCCKVIPCYWAQLWYGITESNLSPCPDLRREESGIYTCLRIKKSGLMKREMLGTGCHYPEFRKETKVLTQIK